MKNKLAYSIIALSYLMMVIGAMGCNVQKRALRKVHQGVRIDKPTVDKYFADNYNITDSIDTRIIYREGKIIIDTLTEIQLEVINDTVYKTAYKTITKLQRDTVDISRFERERNGAVEATLIKEIGKIGAKLTAVTTDLKISQANYNRSKGNNTRLGIIIAVYVLLKVIVGWIGSKMPTGLIFRAIKKVF